MQNSLVSRLQTSLPFVLGGAALAAVITFLPTSRGLADDVTVVPSAVVDETAASAPASETAVLSGGCFWGVQGVFQHVKGVTRVVSGYTGGAAGTAQYDIVSTGETGHAESVQITYDPHVVSYGKLLQVYFSVAHDPTELNYQGPDHGTQYRSAIWTTSDEQKKVADAYVAQLDKAGTFPKPIVTKINPLKTFYDAEGYHQNYLTLHPDNGYIAFNDIPKVENLSKLFPDLYRQDPVLVKVSSAN